MIEYLDDALVLIHQNEETESSCQSHETNRFNIMARNQGLNMRYIDE